MRHRKKLWTLVLLAGVGCADPASDDELLDLEREDVKLIQATDGSAYRVNLSHGLVWNEDRGYARLAPDLTPEWGFLPELPAEVRADLSRYETELGASWVARQLPDTLLERAVTDLALPRYVPFTQTGQDGPQILTRCTTTTDKDYRCTTCINSFDGTDLSESTVCVPAPKKKKKSTK